MMMAAWPEPNAGTLFEIVTHYKDASRPAEIRQVELLPLGAHAVDVLIDMARRESAWVGTGQHYDVCAVVDGVAVARFLCVNFRLSQPARSASDRAPSAAG